MEKTYKFRGNEGLVERGADRYGSKVNLNEKECPSCYGGKKNGLLNCKTCDGAGVVKNAVDYGGGKTEDEARAKLKEMGYTPDEVDQAIKTKKEGQAKADKNNTKETSTANKIMDIDNKILDKYNHTSGVDLMKHKDEFLRKVRESGIARISKDDADALEDNNFHTALEILIQEGMVLKK